MADGDETQTDDELDAEAQSFLDELMEAGFRYDSANRVQGFAGVDDEGVHEGDEDASGSDDSGDETSDDDGEGAPEDSGDDSADDADENDDDESGSEGGGAQASTPGLVDGLPADEVAALLQLRNALIEHPALATEIGEKLDEIRSGRPKEKQEPELPDYIDPDDEGQVAMWNRLQELEGRQQQTESKTEQALVEKAQTEARLNIERAVERFTAAHPDLSAEDIANIRNHTSASVNIPGVMANFPNDPVEGLARALEIGSMSDPLTRDKVLGITKSRDAGDSKRKKNLDALAGSSGSAPRRPGRPKKIEGSQQEKWNQVSKRLVAEFEKLGGSQ